MTLRSDHPPIYAAQDKSGEALLAFLMFATAFASVLIPLAMKFKGMAT